VAPLLVLTTVDESGGFNSQRSVSLLESADARANLAAQLKKVMTEKGYYGVDVDMEYIPANLRQAYTELVAYLKEQLAPAMVFVALAPKTSREQRGLLYEAHDYEGMGKVADRTLIMTYEWGYAFGPTMAVAPLPNVRRVMDYALQEIPPEKLLMGVPNYGYDWKIPFDRNFPARSIGNYEGVAIARKYGANIQYDPQSQAPWFRYYDARRNEHEVWFEDVRSIRAKLLLAAEYGLGGVSVWNMLRYFPGIWSIIDASVTIADGNTDI
jgi:spore germination protein